MSCDKCKKQKTALNNQWVGTGIMGKSTDYKDKTEFSNEWISTNKMMDIEDVEQALNETE